MIIIPFTSSAVTLDVVGGKGANLTRLTRAGFNVPRGYIITTEAYHAFVAANSISQAITAALTGIAAQGVASQLDEASTQIRAAFSAGVLPAIITQEIKVAYAELGPHAPAVAVRSSATTEDLPDLSFAGQQDTYLNIIGEAQLLNAVVECWGSLWTARAIGYRLRNQIPHTAAALAVVVQIMIPSDVSGVLFTANPLTGLLSESVIDATFGLGEALVSGQVEPDHFVVNTLTSATNTVTLGAKLTATRGKAGGGVENVAADVATQQTLTDNEIRQLVAAGQAIQKEYGVPQDIEWAFADHKLYILQSRAITSLFPIPQIIFDPLIVWFSFGALQGLVGPITPIGRDTIENVLAGAVEIFGLRLKPSEATMFASAGERVWIKLSNVIHHPIGNRLCKELLGFTEPSAGQILQALADDPRLGVGTGKFKFSTMLGIISFTVRILARMVDNTLRPEAARVRFDAAIERYLATGRLAPAADRCGRLANSIAFIRERIASLDPLLLPQFIPIFGSSLLALNLLSHLSADSGLALEVTRGLPRNVTTEMDLALWETALALQSDTAASAFFRTATAAVLAQRYLNGTLPSAAQSAVERFLECYGMRGVGEIDLGQPRWREDPTPVMHILQSYLQIDPTVAPTVMFAKGEQAALAAVEKIVAIVRQQPGGWLKEKLVRAAARRVRLLMGTRESPKFFAIRTMGIARQALLAVGQEFVAAGAIERADDLVFLNLAELDLLAQAHPIDWSILIAERRAVYKRELRRRQVPRILVSDGRAFYDGLGAQTDTGEIITGSPVSSGVVAGTVHVVFDPRGTQLVPGEILVCPGTDPAWTPLFMAAGGLITEVGGMMTHGSVVAREYGIPAVVGVHQATSRLKDGQRIRVDGTQGKITLLP